MNHKLLYPQKLRIQANLIWKGQANHDAYANQNEEANQREIPKEWRSHRDHPQENLPTEPAKKMVSISVVRKMMGNVAFVSQIVPSEAEDASEANLDGQAKHDGHSNPNEEVNQGDLLKKNGDFIVILSGKLSDRTYRKDGL